MRYGAARSLQAASRRSVTACRRHASTISAVASSTKLPEKYFDHQQSWHYQEDGLQARRKKPRTMEDEWASAYRKAAGNTELEPEEAEQTYVASEPVSAKTRYAALKEQARAGNAQLSLDSGKDVGRENVNFRDLRVRTTTLDSHGEVSKRRAQIQKSLLCAQHNLQPRDLRRIDSWISNVIPTILVRREAILLNILHIRMLIKANTVILFEPFGSAESSLHQTFVKHLCENLKLSYKASGGLPYEFRALEAALSSASSALEKEMDMHRQTVEELLTSLESRIVAEELRSLLQYSRMLGAFQKRAKTVQAAIDEVLEQDDDLSAMYLSEGAVRPRATDDHQEVEMLLESYSKQIEEIVSEVDTMVANLHQAQDVIELILDSSRNRLLALDLKASIATMGLASGALIAGLFGMNLHSSLETTPHAFWITSGISAIVVLTVTTGGLRRVSQLRRIGLGQGVFGESYSTPRNDKLAKYGMGNSTLPIYGRKGLYYDRSARKHRGDRYERDSARAGVISAMRRAPNYEGY